MQSVLILEKHLTILHTKQDPGQHNHPESGCTAWTERLPFNTSDFGKRKDKLTFKYINYTEVDYLCKEEIIINIWNICIKGLCVINFVLVTVICVNSIDDFFCFPL